MDSSPAAAPPAPAVFRAVDPATGETLATHGAHGPAEVEARLSRAMAAFRLWRRSPWTERRGLLEEAARRLDEERPRWARLMAREMGKPIGAAAAEAAKCAWVCRHYAAHGERYLADEIVATDAARSLVRSEPLGPVLAVMPWNFPFWQVFRFAAPALAAGNVGLLKHAPNVPGCALAIEEILDRAGAPAGLFQNLFVEESAVERLIADPRIAAVTLTGGEAAGAAVGAAAGAALKPAVLELGGSDPFVVLPSADLDAAIGAAVRSRTIANGQSCIAAKRFVVHRALAERFLEGLVAAMAALRVGDPLDDATAIGPLATREVLERLDDQVRRSIAAGARPLLGGRILDRPGNFYEPTVLADVPPDCPAAVEELFGPVAAVFVVDDLDQAIAAANDTRFGLGASVWTREPAEIERLVDAIEAGSVFVNAMVQSDPRLPFGGIKRSGFGRELGSDGIRAFVNRKSIAIAG